jgi:hypothetical protein
MKSRPVLRLAGFFFLTLLKSYSRLRAAGPLPRERLDLDKQRKRRGK